MILTAAVHVHAMDFGLKFQSHNFPSEKRTALTVGDTYFEFDKVFQIGFNFNFYSTTMFGDIATIITNDEKRVSVVASYMNDGTYKLGVMANEELHLLNHPSLLLNPDKEDYIEFSIDKTNNKIILAFNNSEMEVPFDLSRTSSATFLFGMDRRKKRTDVAPIELRKIRLFINGKNTNYWDFKYHNTPNTTIDDLGGVTAIVSNPHWLIDDHSNWRRIYSAEFKENIQTAFDPKTEKFYIVSDKKILTLSPLTGDKSKISVKSGNRVMVYSNHLMYDTISDRLLNYNLTRRCTAVFDLKSASWGGYFNSDDNNEESNHFNHAFAIDGEYMYAFGGYGFYKYHNDLYKMNIITGTIEECNLEPELMPMTSSSAAVVDNKLYLFGGKGNFSGRQELPATYKYTLYAYDLNTWKGEPVWELDSISDDFLPSQTMYYDKENDSFYMASTAHGGEMIRISRRNPEWNRVSTPILSTMDVHDFVFDLFRSKDEKRYYLVLDKRLDPLTHDYNIYTISTPFLNDEQLIQNKTVSTTNATGISFRQIVIYLIFTIILLMTVFFLRIRKRKEQTLSITNKPLKNTESGATDIEAKEENETSNDADAANDENYTFIVSDKPKETNKYFDRSKSSISLLGGFCVRDRNGNDITSKFTSRLKNLLILLLLSCEENKAGIKYQLIDEQIWNDKDEKSAQNNRNVSMRKLRLLLEEIGNISIIYDKGFFKIETNDVFFDYKEISNRIAEINRHENVSPELVNEILELLLMGPLLPNTRYEWLDKYKGNYSDAALTMLNKLLKYEFEKDSELAYRIADTISLHEPLSEEAMIAKCKILSKRKMIGIAQNIHQKFCKEYMHSLGEEYPQSFANVCKMEI